MALRFSCLRLSFEERTQCQGFEGWEKAQGMQSTEKILSPALLTAEAKLTVRQGGAFNEAVCRHIVEGCST